MKRTLLSLFFVIAAPIAAQTVNASGTWLNTDGPNAPWTVQLKQDGGKLTGTMEQNGGLRGSVDIYEGTVSGNAVSFKARSPDGAREITFAGTITGDEITLNRSTLDRTGESQGGGGLFGTDAAPRFTIRRRQRWVVTEGVAFIPWTLDLTVEDKTVTGVVGQAGSDPPSGYATTAIGPFSVYDGRASGSTIDFKVKTGDGGRIVTFHGTRNGDQIQFTRSVEVVRGDRGLNGILGAAGATHFTARLKPVATLALGGTGRVRLAGTDLFRYKGAELDASAIKYVPNRDAILDSLRRQIDIVDEAVTDPAQKAFLMSVPLTISATVTAASDSALYSAGLKNIVLLPQIFDPEKPVILHELMHAYHDQKLPNGYRNADIQTLYRQAQNSGQFPAGIFMLSNPVEYFAMMASVYLHGSAKRDPYTRHDIQEKQPDCYQWLLKEFGPR